MKAATEDSEHPLNEVSDEHGKNTTVISTKIDEVGSPVKRNRPDDAPPDEESQESWKRVKHASSKAEC